MVTTMVTLGVADELDAVRTAVHDGPQLISEALHLFPHGGQALQVGVRGQGVEGDVGEILPR